MSQDTIAALASQAGGAVAVIRISGPAVLSALEKLCGLEDVQARLPARFLNRVKILDPVTGRQLDDALAVYFAGPKSFTGEDCAELQIHGGVFLAQKILTALWTCGVRQALPGEFSLRAVRNGKMKITEAEAIADLIGAKNEGAITLALEKMSGTQSRLVMEFAEELRTLCTLGELGIDFSDQDVEEVSLRALKKRATQILEKLKLFEASYERGSRLQNGVKVAFVGLPNAGKSSFFNAVLGEDRSIVSDVAGTTRDVVRETLNLPVGDGTWITLRLEDTAGLRASSDTVEQMGIERSFAAARDADLVVLVLDSQTSETGLDQICLELEKIDAGRGHMMERTLGVLTKIDLGSSGASTVTLAQIKAKLPTRMWVETSAVTHYGILGATQSLAHMAQEKVARNAGEVLLTREDHLQAVKGAQIHLVRGLAAPAEDLFASDLRQALVALSPLIGTTLPDDILGRIFSQFCIGK